MLRIENVSKTYAKANKKAVDSLTLEVKDGEIFGFLGPNGAGKSTTIKMITGILQPDSGNIYIDGHNLKQENIKAKLSTGYVPDEHNTFDKLTGNEYLNFMGTMYNVPQNLLAERKKKYLELFNLEGNSNEVIKSYSHGMRQKLLVIGALIHDPKLWILDEPLTGLDPESAFQLKKLMRSHADKGNTVFFSSHVIDVVEKVCDRVAIVHHGKLVAVDTLASLKADTSVSLEEIFLDITAKEDNRARLDSVYSGKL